MSVTAAFIPVIIEQHAEEATFLWLLRSYAVHAPHYKLKDLAKLDERVEAHLDGLRIAGIEGWRLCEQALEIGESGEVFVAAVLALESRDWKRIRAVMDHAQQGGEAARGLLSAFGWVEPSVLSGTVKNLLVASGSPFQRSAGIAACAYHRVDPGKALDDLVRDPSVPAEVLCRAIRAAGELRRRDLLQDIKRHLTSEDVTICSWAAWSSVLMGDRGPALEYLKGLVLTGSDFARRALPIVVRSLDHRSAVSWLHSLSERPGRDRHLLLGMGALGDAQYIPWLIQKMKNPELARAAGEAFSMITGIDIAYLDLEAESPAGFEAGPSESTEDENVALDPDENLPWPDPQKIDDWWTKHSTSFPSGVRYLAGAPASASQAHKILCEGYQRQRIAASIELALRTPDEPWFNVNAPGVRQQRALGIARFA